MQYLDSKLRPPPEKSSTKILPREDNGKLDIISLLE